MVQVQIFLFGPKILSLSSILIRQRVGHGPTHGPKKSCMIRGHIQGRRRRGVRGDLEVSGNGIRTVVCTCTLHPEGARVRLRTEQRHRRADAVVRARAAGRGGSPPPRDRQIGDIYTPLSDCSPAGDVSTSSANSYHTSGSESGSSSSRSGMSDDQQANRYRVTYRPRTVHV